MLVFAPVAMDLHSSPLYCYKEVKKYNSTVTQHKTARISFLSETLLVFPPSCHLGVQLYLPSLQ